MALRRACTLLHLLLTTQIVKPLHEQFFVASSVYYILSVQFPALETFMDAAVLPLDSTRSSSPDSDDVEKTGSDIEDEKDAAQAEVRTAKSERE